MQRAALLVLVACGSSPPATRPAPAPDPVPAAVVVPPTISAPSPCADAEACHHAAEEHEAEGRYTDAVDAYARACELGEVAACFARGIVLRARLSDDAAAHAAFVQACERGLADGCAQVGTDLLAGTGVTMDPEAGRAALDAACTGGSGLACNNLGVLLQSGALGPVDARGALAKFTLACTHGSANGCTEQARATKDRRRALALHEQACSLSARACGSLADVLRASDPARARELYDRACGAGSPPACHQLDVMRAGGQGAR